jgi:DNA polymerase
VTDGFIDFETRSRVQIRDGTDRYMAGPEYMDAAEATICTLAVDDGPVMLWDILTEPEPKWFYEVTADPLITLVAANFQHDRQTMEQLLGRHTLVSRWRCTRAQANAHGLPGGLEGQCAALQVPLDLSKVADGKRLIQVFCVPRKDGTYVEPTERPNEWEAFKHYARSDILALRAVYRRLPAHNYTGANLRYFWLDATINERGFAVDLPLIEAAVVLLDRAKGRGDADVSNRTGGAVTAVTQRDKLLRYLQERGVALPNLRKSELENALQCDDLSPEQRFLIEARLEGARASGAKYKRAIKMHVDGRLRYTMQFSGAGRTGRTAHKGFQPGNMPRAVTYNPLAPTLAEQHVPVKAKFIDEVILPAIRDGSALDNDLVFGGPNTVAANALRHTIVAASGNELICADYKNVESRVLAWLAGEDWKCLAYAAADRGEGEDLYRMLYSRFFGVALEKVNDHERQAGKVVELACGFGGSVGAFVTMAVGYGIDLSTLPALVLPNAPEKSLKKAEQVWWRAFLTRDDFDLEPKVFQAIHVLVQMYRAANPKIDSLKKSLGRAVENAIRRRGSLHEVGRCKIWATADVLIVELPSGYRLCYWSPEIATEKIVDPETGEEEDRTYLSFKRARGAKMIRERSWPGLTLENIVQAVANQLLRWGSLEIEAVYPGIQILSVHDEALSEARKGAVKLEHYIELMCKGWYWTRGLPLAADGWTGPRYGKR